MRPPNLSVHMPSGTRMSEPVSTGVAVSRPNSVALRLSVFLIGMPITPNIIHTMKHTVNASVLTISTDSACLRLPMNANPLPATLFRASSVGGGADGKVSFGGRGERGRKNDARTRRHRPEELLWEMNAARLREIKSGRARMR